MDKVYLRAFEPDDFKTTIHWRKDESLWPLLGSQKHFVSQAYEKKWIEDAINGKNGIKLAVCDKETHQHIGNVYLSKINNTYKSAEIGILIGERAFHGKGYGTAAIRLMLDYAFLELGMHRITALILEDNIASRKTFEKLGFKEEGLLRHSVFKGGQFRNQIAVSLLDYEYAVVRGI